MMPASYDCLRFIACLGAAMLSLSSVANPIETKPNIVFILADDMGYGDIEALNADCQFPTPHLNRLADEGMVFTDAHSSSSVCTPTRYALLTGRYNWRSRLESSVCWGFSRRLIEPGRSTIASILKANGYATAAIGKWHLGMDWPLKQGGFADDGDRWDANYQGGWDVDYRGNIQNGPLSVGFDYFFGISASLDMPPYVYIEDDKPQVTRIVEKKFLRSGPADIDFEAIDVLPRLTEKAISYIRKRANPENKEQPFFLYMPLNAPHTPILPTPEWQDKSGLNKYGDFTMQVDDSVGKVLQAIDENGFKDNTLFIFSTDNGCSPAADIPSMEARGHYANYHFRGHKADIFEGGHRVPFLVRWPDVVAAGSRSGQLICQTDLTATAAEILDIPLKDNEAEDSFSFLHALKQKNSPTKRSSIVHHSINGSFAIREADWKLSLCAGSGGWSAPRPGPKNLAGLPPLQLYNLTEDISETTNRFSSQRPLADILLGKLNAIVDQGRSTHGAPQSNSRTIDIFKAGRQARGLKGK